MSEMKVSYKEKAKENLLKLVQKFENELSSGLINEYNEEETKKSFIEPFLKDVLGWNVNDRDEVSAEERVSRGRVDYGLKLEGNIRLFIEAKKPQVDLSKYIEQAVGYGYSHRGGVPFVLLTNFEELKLFDVTVKPDLRNPQKGLKINLAWNQYLNNFDKLWLLSKESVSQGELDKLLLAKPKARSLIEDKAKAILGDIKRWKEILAKDIFKNNPDFFHSGDLEKDSDYLKEITQKILDRIIFIRSCEDRGLIQRRSLKENFEERTKVVGMNTMLFLREEFNYYNAVFDSDLFRFQDWEPNLAIDFKVMQDIILETYIPYQFDVIPIEILGNIYEQYLGYTIRLTDHLVKYELKPELRKAGGVYYTPEYIVDYIVENTVGKSLGELPLNKIKKLRILDPACGSGSFLIRAYEEMLAYYRKQKSRPRKYPSGQGKLDLDQAKLENSLTLQEKSEILLRHIFGVDLDEQAVEVTKLSLMLKMLEGESGAILGRAILPMLNQNIKSGNSLISGGKKELEEYFGEDWRKVRPFNWREEFRGILKSEGGFDAVIGNPPYVNVENLNGDERRFLMNNYRNAIKRFDIYVAFIERGLALIKKGGKLSYIIPYPFLNQNYAEALRKNILEDYQLDQIVDLSEIKVFAEATVRNCIIVINNPVQKKRKGINIFKAGLSAGSNVPEIIKARTMPLDLIKKMPKYMFRVDTGAEDQSLLSKIGRMSISLGNLCYINWGARTGNIKKFVVEKIIDSDCKKMINARNIDRYSLEWDGKYIWYLKEQLYNPMFEELFENEKLVFRDISGKARLKATYDNQKFYAEHTVSLCVPKHLLQTVKRTGINYSQKEIELSRKYNLKMVLATANSRLVNYYFQKLLGGGLHVYPDDVKKLPVYEINFSNLKEKNIHDHLVELADTMLDLNRRVQGARGWEKEQIQRQIEKTDGEIDDLVYKLYGIADQEKKVIEGEFKE